MPEPRSVDAELKRLRGQIELEKAQIELTALRKHKGKPIEKSFRRRLTEWFLGAGAFAAVVGGGVDYLQGTSKDSTEITKAICDNAHKAVQDEQTNPGLTLDQNRKYVSDQLKIVEKCNRQLK
jgi:hypothetical protein